MWVPLDGARCIQHSTATMNDFRQSGGRIFTKHARFPKGRTAQLPARRIRQHSATHTLQLLFKLGGVVLPGFQVLCLLLVLPAQAFKCCFQLLDLGPWCKLISTHTAAGCSTMHLWDPLSLLFRSKKI